MTRIEAKLHLNDARTMQQYALYDWAEVRRQIDDDVYSQRIDLEDQSNNNIEHNNTHLRASRQQAVVQYRH